MRHAKSWTGGEEIVGSLRPMKTLAESDIFELMRMSASIAHMAKEHHAARHPKSAAWTQFWSEIRQIVGGPGIPPQTALILVTYNRRTRKRSERVFAVGTGDCPVCTVLDLVIQLREEARELSPRPRILMVDDAYPIGMFGTHVVGRG